MEIFTYTDKATFNNEASLFILKHITQVLPNRSACSIVLAGGKTPRAVYENLGLLLGEAKIPAQKIHFFLGDERPVDGNADERNEKMIRNSLFRAYPPNPANVHFWQYPPRSVVAVAGAYEKMLGEFFQNGAAGPDIVLLGLGEDGHTASLFPHAMAFSEDGSLLPVDRVRHKNALAVYRPDTDDFRLSLSFSFLNRATRKIFLIGGENKKSAFDRLVRRDPQIPAAHITDRLLSAFFLA